MKRFLATALAVAIAGSVHAGDQPVFVTAFPTKGNPDILYYVDAGPTAVIRGDAGVAVQAQNGATAGQPVAAAGLSPRDGNALYARLMEEARARGLK